MGGGGFVSVTEGFDLQNARQRKIRILFTRSYRVTGSIVLPTMRSMKKGHCHRPDDSIGDGRNPDDEGGREAETIYR